MMRSLIAVGLRERVKEGTESVLFFVNGSFAPQVFTGDVQP